MEVNYFCYFLLSYCPRKQNLVRFTTIPRRDITAGPRAPDCACNEGHMTFARKVGDKKSIYKITPSRQVA